MATTTNYGWTTPNDTDLVKDGAAAIRTLGSSIDTTTKALNPSTTLGDIEYRSSTANTNTRLGIGSNGQYLSVSGGVPAWVTLQAGGMTLLSTTSLSGTTTTVSSIDGTYNDLLILVRGTTFATDQASIEFRFNGAGAINSIGAVNVNGTDSLRLYNNFFKTDNNMLNTSANNVFAFEVDSYANTSRYKSVKFYGGMQLAAGGTFSINQMGMLQTNSAVTSFEVTTSNGYTFNGGQILIYGVK